MPIQPGRTPPSWYLALADDPRGRPGRRAVWLVNEGPAPLPARFRYSATLDLDSGPVSLGRAPWADLGPIVPGAPVRLVDDLGAPADLVLWFTIEVAGADEPGEWWVEVCLENIPGSARRIPGLGAALIFAPRRARAGG